MTPDVATIGAALSVITTVAVSTWQLSSRLARVESAVASVCGRLDEHCRGHQTFSLDLTPPNGHRLR